MKIFFDMDGTIANLYEVENWLDFLIAENPKPYKEAKVMVNMSSFARLLNKIQEKGIKIGIISWLSKNGSDKYNEEVTKVKKSWLKKHLKSVLFDSVDIVKYGTKKSLFITSRNDILFDDEEQNRNNWTGKAYDEKNILENLKKILNKGE